jgi:hypothetical protein
MGLAGFPTASPSASASLRQTGDTADEAPETSRTRSIAHSDAVMKPGDTWLVCNGLKRDGVTVQVETHHSVQRFTHFFSK